MECLCISQTISYDILNNIRILRIGITTLLFNIAVLEYCSVLCIKNIPSRTSAVGWHSSMGQGAV